MAKSANEIGVTDTWTWQLLCPPLVRSKRKIDRDFFERACNDSLKTDTKLVPMRFNDIETADGDVDWTEGLEWASRGNL